MIAVDTSALVAILEDEPESADFSSYIDRVDYACVSAASVIEASLVVYRRKSLSGLHLLDRLLEQLRLDIVPLTHVHIAQARHALVAYGKGRHPAGLNFGDCFAYALAKETGYPLLYKGEDFAQTDIVSAL